MLKKINLFRITFRFVSLYVSVCTSKEYKQFSVENYALPQHKYKTISRTDFSTCQKACETKRACISVNFGDSVDGVGCCTLNDCGVEDEENKGKSLVFTPGCLYHQVRPTEAAIFKGGKYSGYCPVKEKPKVGSLQIPGKSCRQILQVQGSAADGEYWIDPKRASDPFKVYCDMTTAGGGWTLIKQTVLTSSAPLEIVIKTSDYKMISQKIENRIVHTAGLTKLKQDMGFDQLRFYCRKKSVGRTFHIMTKNDALGRDAVRSMILKFLPQAKACGSYTVMPDDTSVLSQNCQKWGYKSGYEVNKWGAYYPGLHGNDRLYRRSAFAKIKGKVISMACIPKLYCCDDSTSSNLSVGDKFEIYVR